MASAGLGDLRHINAPAPVARADGRAIKQAKEASGMTVRELSAKSGVSESRLYSLMRGRTHESFVSPVTLRVIAEVLGVDAETLAFRPQDQD